MAAKFPDEIDLRLIDLLQKDAKATLQELGEQVGLKSSSVMERLRKLERSGVIVGYHAHVNPRQLGFDVTAFIGVGLDYPKHVEAFVELLEQEPAISECHHVTGQHTLLLKVRTPNTAGLEMLIRRLRSVEGVASTETTVVLSTLQEECSVPVMGRAGEEA